MDFVVGLVGFATVVIIIFFGRQWKELKDSFSLRDTILRIFFGRQWKELKDLRNRYAPIIDMDAEVSTRRKQVEKLDASMKNKRNEITAADRKLEEIKADLAIYDEKAAFMELGMYEPQFEFGDSDRYKEEIKNIKALQKDMVTGKVAVVCRNEWTVDGNKAKGRAMTNRGIKMVLRAFNNECDAVIAKVSWNNVKATIKRIERAFEQINRLNESHGIYITDKYLNLKVKESDLAFKYREKQKQERDERAEIVRQKREEAKLQQEIAKAAADEEKAEELLEKARRDNAKEEEIARLTKLLEEAHAKNERAKSMAEQTRAGHVYVISNIGSFGERVFKIGLTRRLDPYDRVKELGDASVPFAFDVHAIVFSENAPRLETELHRVFDAHRVNRANNRKEFFRADLADIKAKLLELVPSADVSSDIEAREYQETLAMERHQNTA